MASSSTNQANTAVHGGMGKTPTPANSVGGNSIGAAEGTNRRVSSSSPSLDHNSFPFLLVFPLNLHLLHHEHATTDTTLSHNRALKAAAASSQVSWTKSETAPMQPRMREGRVSQIWSRSRGWLGRCGISMSLPSVPFLCFPWECVYQSTLWLTFGNLVSRLDRLLLSDRSNVMMAECIWGLQMNKCCFAFEQDCIATALYAFEQKRWVYWHLLAFEDYVYDTRVLLLSSFWGRCFFANVKESGPLLYKEVVEIVNQLNSIFCNSKWQYVERAQEFDCVNCVCM